MPDHRTKGLIAGVALLVSAVVARGTELDSGTLTLPKPKPPKLRLPEIREPRMEAPRLRNEPLRIPAPQQPRLDTAPKLEDQPANDQGDESD